jgi:hypothetical protein
MVANQEFGVVENQTPEKKITGAMESSATPIEFFWGNFLPNENSFL